MKQGQPIPIDRVLIIDFGSQYTQLIARCVRDLNVYSEIHCWSTITPDLLKDFAPACMILSGGPESTLESLSPTVDRIIYEQGVPLLGICYGMQTMANQLGGVVEASSKREFGSTVIECPQKTPLLEGWSEQEIVWMSHGEHVTRVPPGFSVIANSHNSEIAAMADVSRDFYALQFHPEVTHTQNGLRLLQNFVVNIARCQQTWQTQTIVDHAIQEIQQQLLADEGVVLGLSGGVDSAVACALLQRAIGKQLHCIFVDTGLLRLGEVEQVIHTFQQGLGVNLIHVSAAQRFYKELRGIADPEEKRQRIGNLFIEIFEEHAKQLKNVRWLAQGTIYPDRIESAAVETQSAHLIKSHHNVGGLPEAMNLQLLEPLKYLFKDEVRRIGTALGLPPDILGRHPFPGPGLAVRIVGEMREEYIHILQCVDAIFIEELHTHDFYNKIGQAFAVFLPVKSVGVMGDRRDYSHVVVLRAVETSDFMTANIFHFPPKFLEQVSTRIINEVVGVSRVCYDISSKPPATIEWE